MADCLVCPENRQARVEKPKADITFINNAVRPEGGEEGYGIFSYLKAKLGPKVADRVQQMRLALCKSCDEVDSKGEPFFREINGAYYCGNPRGITERRNEVTDGCGCKLSDKTRFTNAACPVGKWGPGNKFGAGVIPLVMEPRAGDNMLKGTIDIIQPSSKLPDFTGIGDTIMFGIIMQALKKKYEAEGYKIRYGLPQVRIEWARIATAGKVELFDIGDPDREFGEYQFYSNDMRAMELEETARQMETDKLGWFIKRFNLNRESVIGEYEVLHEEDTLDRGPLLKAKARNQPIVLLSPYAHSHMRTWPKRHMLQLLWKLRKLGALVVTMHHNDKEVQHFHGDQYIALEPKDIIALIRESDLLIGNDSGMVHVAGFLRKPAIAICGPTNGETIYGAYDSVYPLQAPGPCTGCSWFKENGYKPWCIAGCNMLNNLQPDQVIEAATRYVDIPHRIRVTKEEEFDYESIA